MGRTNIEKLNECGQSVWLDHINRSMLATGKLEQRVKLGLRGLTSNPTIFDKAISNSSIYDRQISQLRSKGKSDFEIYDELTVEDIQQAADAFKALYEQTNGLDGYVSLEVNPRLASKAQETIKEVKRLHGKVKRANVMFKVPATEEGFIAAEELIADGINLNATLIFSLEQYIKTARAYISGISRLIKSGRDASRVRSVASVFISRIDTSVDELLDEKIMEEADQGEAGVLNSLKGKAAVSNAKIIYAKFLEIFSSAEFKELQERRANLQRVLWGSTSTKNPAYSDIKYVAELIGRDTVNTMPEDTFEAFQDHGEAKAVLGPDIKEANDIIISLKRIGIDINDLCAILLKDGVSAFVRSFDSLLNSINQKMEMALKS